MCLCVFHLITREERNSESSFLEVGGDWGYWIFTQWGFSKHTVLCCAGGGGIFTLSISIVFRTHISVSFYFLLLMEHTFCLIFYCFCYTRDKSEFIFVRFFLECGFCFFFFFCNFLGRDEPFNVFNCCNDLLHQVILLVFF